MPVSHVRLQVTPHVQLTLLCDVLYQSPRGSPLTLVQTPIAQDASCIKTEEGKPKGELLQDSIVVYTQGRGDRMLVQFTRLQLEQE